MTAKAPLSNRLYHLEDARVAGKAMSLPLHAESPDEERGDLFKHVLLSACGRPGTVRSTGGL